MVVVAYISEIAVALWLANASVITSLRQGSHLESSRYRS